MKENSHSETFHSGESDDKIVQKLTLQQLAFYQNKHGTCACVQQQSSIPRWCKHVDRMFNNNQSYTHMNNISYQFKISHGKKNFGGATDSCTIPSSIAKLHTTLTCTMVAKLGRNHYTAISHHVSPCVYNIVHFQHHDARGEISLL